MTFVGDEMDSSGSGMALRQAHTPLLTMDELIRAYARLPLDSDDRQELLKNFAARMSKGWRLSPMPLDPSLENVSREAKRAFIERTAPQGIALVTAWDLGASILILKTDAGKGFLGRQKASYTCFLSEASDGFERAGVAPTIPKAFGILDGLYEVTDRVNRALG